MREKTEKKLLQRILILVSSLAFFGSSGAALIDMLVSTPQKQEAIATQTNSIEQELQAKERGYELVLEREPENTSALQGLVQTRLDLKNYQGAIAPMEKLLKMYPQEEQLKALLQEIKKQAELNSKESQK